MNIIIQVDVNGIGTKLRQGTQFKLAHIYPWVARKNKLTVQTEIAVYVGYVFSTPLYICDTLEEPSRA